MKDQGYFGLQYRAYREDWVHVQHIDLKSYGGEPKAEHNRQLPYAQVDQGQVGISITPSSAGYLMREGDRFIPPDALMEFSTVIDTKVGETQSRHFFVGEVVRAYGINAAGNREVEVLGVTYDPQKQRFILPSLPDMPAKLVIIYRASPIYVAFLDQSEFRHQGTQKQNRVALLVREEIAR